MPVDEAVLVTTVPRRSATGVPLPGVIATATPVTMPATGAPPASTSTTWTPATGSIVLPAAPVAGAAVNETATGTGAEAGAPLGLPLLHPTSAASGVNR